MELYKLKEGALISQSTDKDLIIDGVLYSPVPEIILRADGWKDLIKAVIISPLTWFQDSILSYTETEAQIIEQYEVVSKTGLRSIVTAYYNAICDETILKGFYFKGLNLWLTAETQTNISTDFLASSLYQSQAIYPKFYNFDGQLWPLNNLSELAELFNAAKEWKMTCLEECWANKLLDFTEDEELYAELIRLNR